MDRRKITLIKLTTFYAFTGRSAGTSFRGTEATGRFDTFRGTASATERRICIVGRTIGNSSISFGLIRMFLTIRTIIRTIAERHRSDLTGTS